MIPLPSLPDDIEVGSVSAVYDDGTCDVQVGTRAEPWSRVPTLSGFPPVHGERAYVIILDSGVPVAVTESANYVRDVTPTDTDWRTFGRVAGRTRDTVDGNVQPSLSAAAVNIRSGLTMTAPRCTADSVLTYVQITAGVYALERYSLSAGEGAPPAVSTQLPAGTPWSMTLGADSAYITFH